MNGLVKTKIQMNRNSTFLNRYKKDITARTVMCIITAVDEKKFTVDAFIPSSTSTISKIVIANNIVGDGVSMKMLPAINQKGVLLLSNQHPPMLIATIPNTREELENTLLCGEFKIGDEDSFIKLSKNKAISSRTLGSVSVLDNKYERKIVPKSEIVGFGFEEESFINNDTLCGARVSRVFSVIADTYAKKKSDIVKGNVINKEVCKNILADNSTLMSKLHYLISMVEECDESIEIGSPESIDKLNELKESIQSSYLSTRGAKIIEVNVGDTDKNIIGNSSYSVSVTTSDKNSSLLFKNDGTIEINCTDLLVNKEVIK